MTQAGKRTRVRLAAGGGWPADATVEYGPERPTTHTRTFPDSVACDVFLNGHKIGSVASVRVMKTARVTRGIRKDLGYRVLWRAALNDEDPTSKTGTGDPTRGAAIRSLVALHRWRAQHA